ncbi:MAG: Crp/Fnr family transcriptional regulator [Spirochaetales bacterium]|nr:Crp/Fnr family transcriptional regulator [Spirochaetales bacterium]
MDYSLLKQCALFEKFEEAEIENLLKDTEYKLKEFGKGDVIFRAMNKADEIAIILDGHMQIAKTFPNGNQINVSIRKKGSLVGPAAVFSDEGRYPCDVVSVDNSSILFLSKTSLLALLGKSSILLSSFLSIIASSSAMLQRRLELMSYSSIQAKVAFYLLINTRRSGKNKVLIPESISNWALVMNVSRTSLHREIAKMEKLGLIRYSSPFIDVLDKEGLQNVLS